ncbi:MAG: FHA domain-containing protein [Thermoanaerobaculia bacterium]
MPEIPVPSLKVLEEGKLRAEHPLQGDRDLVLGSAPGADLVVAHPAVSESHARIYAEDGQLVLEDLGSGEGTYLDGQRLEGPARLRHGQQIVLGQPEGPPLVLKFEDPASQLLEDLGLLAPAKKERPKAERTAESILADLAQDSAKEAGAAAVEAAADPPPVSRPLIPRPWLPLVASVATAAAVALVWTLLSYLQPASPFWRSVQLAPAVATGGANLVLRSPDIRPREQLTVSLAGVALPQVEIGPGKLVVRVPELPARSTGLYDVPMDVRAGGHVLYHRVLPYAVRPQLFRAKPEKARVGDLVTLEGKGLTDERERVTVRFGNTAVVPEAAEPERIEVRVPALARLAAVAVPVEISVDNWTAALPQLLSVEPRNEEPLAFRLSARFDPERAAWRVSHPFGPAFYLPGPEAADGSPPPLVALALDRWDQLFELARNNPGVRVEAETAERLCTLVARGRGLEPPLALVTWRQGELARLAGGSGSQLSSELVCSWMAGAWNHFLEAFSRGHQIPQKVTTPAYVTVLNRLVAANRAGGGYGRPEQREIDALSRPERQVLAQALYPPPRAAASIAGPWVLELENIFSREIPYQAVLRLTLTQQERALSGNGELSLATDKMEMKLPRTAGHGELEASSPPRIHFVLDFPKPVGEITLEGRLGRFGLEGVFTAKEGRISGRFQGLQPLEPALAEPASELAAGGGPAPRSLTGGG